MTQPATQADPKPEPISCCWCDGTGRDESRAPGNRACTHCTDGLTTEWYCGVCCEEYDLARPTYYPKGIDRPHRTPRLIDYTIGCRRTHVCEYCAPQEAIGDGAHLRELIDRAAHLLLELSQIHGSRVGFAVGYAKEIQAGLLDLAAWAGVAQGWEDAR